MKIRILLFLISALWLISTQSTKAQTDSTSTKDSVAIEPESKKEKKEVKSYEVYPRKAALRSAVLPGWGQYSNFLNSKPRKPHYLKIPVFYGLMGAAGYYFYYNNTNYKEYRTAYIYAVDDDPSTNHSLMANYSSSTLKTFRDDFRKKRDLSVILTLGAYTLNIIDAYVFAHLIEFDMSDDLSLHISPTIFSNIATQPSAAIAFQLRF